MNAYEQYIEWLKWMGQDAYQRQVDTYGKENVQIILEDEDEAFQKEHVIYMLKITSYEDSPYELYYNLQAISKYYYVQDIKMIKVEDREGFQDDFFVYVWLEKRMVEPTKNAKKFLALLEKIVQNKQEFMYAWNHLPNHVEDHTQTIYYTLQELQKQQEKMIRLVTKQKQKKDSQKQQVCAQCLQNRYTIMGANHVRKCLKVKPLSHRQYTNTLSPILKTISKKAMPTIVILTETDLPKQKALLEILQKETDCIKIVTQKGIEASTYDFYYPNTNRLLQNLKAYHVYVVGEEKVEAENVIFLPSADILEKKSFQKVILQNISYLTPFANLDNRNSVKVLSATFLDFEGTNYYSGGAERYLIDLHQVCAEMGYKLRIYQKANYEYVRYYRDIEVVGISNHKKDYDYSYEANCAIAQTYKELQENTTQLNIFSAFMENNGIPMKPSIGISHGVAWDYPNENKKKKIDLNEKVWVIDSANACDKIISVDTNTANYFQTADYALGHNTQVIPNYVNIDEFKQEGKKNTSRTVILYPRRLYKPRGLYLLLNITDKLLETYPNVEIRFVGKGFEKDTQKVEEKIAKWGDRVKMYHCAPENMHLEYKNADISLIPTLYSEGTSLSCLEAMATGNAVIATRIGGLTDLIIPNYNGKLIEPNEEALFTAISDYLEHPEEMEKCKKNAVKIAKEFNKEKWKSTWKQVIQNMAKAPTQGENVQYKIVKLYTTEEALQEEAVKSKLLQTLKENSLLYIVTEENTHKKESFGRLQFIGKETLYRKPDEVYVYQYNQTTTETNTQEWKI